MDLYLAHGSIDLVEVEALERDFLGYVEIEGLGVVDKVDLSLFVQEVP